MKQLLVLSLAFLLLISFSVFAQEKEMKMGKQEMKENMGKGMQEMPEMAPPKSLQSEWNDWMVGEWQGYTTSPMGKSKDWMKVQYALGNQYIKIHVKAENVETNEEAVKAWQEQMNLSDEQMEAMMDMKYEGMGLTTKDPKTGKQMGWWFDNWRSQSTGTGEKVSENKASMKWEGPMGVETRTIEKVGENKMVMTFKSTGPMGDWEGKSEYTRVMDMKPASEKPMQGAQKKSKK
jgi:hypothetical protein